ncbi:MAG: DUF190 domain-containing protein [Acidimicrobiales bacterium]
MPLEVNATRLMVFITEDDRVGHGSLDKALVQRAREEGLAGATVWRGVEGFGASGHLRSTRFPDLARGLPLVVELIDLPDRIDAFLPVVRELAGESFVTKENVRMVRRHLSAAPGLDDPVPREERRH